MTKEIVAVRVQEIAPGEFSYKFYNGIELPVTVTPEFQKIVTPTVEHFAALAVRGTWEKLRELFLLPPDPSKDDTILPIISLKMIEKNRFLIMCSGGTNIDIIWTSDEADREVSYEEAAAKCRDILIDGFNKTAFGSKEKGGEWENAKTSKQGKTN